MQTDKSNIFENLGKRPIIAKGTTDPRHWDDKQRFHGSLRAMGTSIKSQQEQKLTYGVTNNGQDQTWVR